MCLYRGIFGYRRGTAMSAMRMFGESTRRPSRSGPGLHWLGWERLFVAWGACRRWRDLSSLSIRLPGASGQGGQGETLASDFPLGWFQRSRY